jgi:Flp pilus assembly pilin Flp
MFRTIQNLLADESGQGLTEYALILALVAVAAYATLQGLAGSINGELGKAASDL